MKSKKLIQILSVVFTFVFFMALTITISAIVKNDVKTETHAAHIEGLGTRDNPYLVYTVTGYKTLLTDYSVDGYTKIYVKLMNDLIITISDKTGLPNWISHQNATLTDMFLGGVDFDGNYKEIKYNCTITLDGNGQINSIAPIPGVVGPSTIKNLRTRGSIKVYGKSSFPPNLSGLLGYAMGINATGLFQPNVTIDNCYVDVDISAQTDEDVAGSAGLIGYACNYSGGLYGNISVTNTIYCGNISGNFWNVGKITSSTEYSNCQISVSSSNTYFTGSIQGHNADIQDSVGYSYAVKSGNNAYVSGKWSNYSSMGYTASPTIGWLKNRNGVTSYSVQYEAVTTDGVEIASGSIANVAKDYYSITCSNGLITLINFGVTDRTFNVSEQSQVSGYKYQSYSVSGPTSGVITYTLVYEVPVFTITFGNIEDGVVKATPSKASIEAKAGESITMGCTHTATATRISLTIGDDTITWEVTDVKYTVLRYGNFSVWTAEYGGYYNSSIEDDGWTKVPDFMRLYGIDYFRFTPSIQLKTYNTFFQ